MEPSTNPICLRMDLFSTNFSVFIATSEPWPPGSTNCVGMSWKETDQSRSLERIRPPLCDTGAEILGHRSSFVCPWSFAARLVTCEPTLWESSGFKVCASDNVLIASDGSGGSRETPQFVRQVAFGAATSLQAPNDTSFKLLRTGFFGGQVPDRQTVRRDEQLSKSSAVSTRSRTSKSRMMRSM